MRVARSPLTASLAILACLALAGCASSSADAGWTFAPVPSATAAASAAASGGPVASGSAPASVAPVTSASPVASAPPTTAASTAPSAAASGGSATVDISALNVAFEQSSVDAPAGAAFTIQFDNKDASIPHDVWIKDAGGTAVFQGAVVTGPAQATYNVPALAAGTYTFFCSIHSNMTGTLVVK